MTKYMIEKSREYPVAKSNTLARIASTASLYEQRAALYILSKLTKEDTDSYIANPDVRIKQVFNLEDFCKVCKMPRGGKTRKEIENALLQLSRPHLQDYEKEDGNWGTHTVAYLAYANVNYKQGLVLVEMHTAIMPHLLDLRERFIAYELEQTLSMKSLFSSQLYERLLSFRKNAGTPQQAYYYFEVPDHSIGKMKEFFGVEGKYKANKDFYRKVLDKAVEEINVMTDLEVTCDRYGRGDNVTVSFDVRYKADRHHPSVNMMAEFDKNAKELKK